MRQVVLVKSRSQK